MPVRIFCLASSEYDGGERSKFYNTLSEKSSVLEILGNFS